MTKIQSPITSPITSPRTGELTATQAKATGSSYSLNNATVLTGSKGLTPPESPTGTGKALSIAASQLQGSSPPATPTNAREVSAEEINNLASKASPLNLKQSNPPPSSARVTAASSDRVRSKSLSATTSAGLSPSSAQTSTRIDFSKYEVVQPELQENQGTPNGEIPRNPPSGFQPIGTTNRLAQPVTLAPHTSSGTPLNGTQFPHNPPSGFQPIGTQPKAKAVPHVHSPTGHAVRPSHHLHHTPSPSSSMLRSTLFGVAESLEENLDANDASIKWSIEHLLQNQGGQNIRLLTVPFEDDASDATRNAALQAANKAFLDNHTAQLDDNDRRLFGTACLSQSSDGENMCLTLSRQRYAEGEIEKVPADNKGNFDEIRHKNGDLRGEPQYVTTTNSQEIYSLLHTRAVWIPNPKMKHEDKPKSKSQVFYRLVNGATIADREPSTSPVTLSVPSATVTNAPSSTATAARSPSPQEEATILGTRLHEARHSPPNAAFDAFYG